MNSTTRDKMMEILVYTPLAMTALAILCFAQIGVWKLKTKEDRKAVGSMLLLLSIPVCIWATFHFLGTTAGILAALAVYATVCWNGRHIGEGCKAAADAAAEVTDHSN